MLVKPEGFSTAVVVFCTMARITLSGTPDVFNSARAAGDVSHWQSEFLTLAAMISGTRPDLTMLTTSRFVITVRFELRGGDCWAGLWPAAKVWAGIPTDRKSTRLNSSHLGISYAVFCLKK